MNEIPLLQLILTRGIGNAALRKFAESCVRENLSPEAAVQKGPRWLCGALGISEDMAENIPGAADSAARLWDDLRRQSVSILWIGDNQYPARLKAILGNQAPAFLFLKGDAKLFDLPAMGFCGARKASEKGIDVTRDTATALAAQNICVVSGYAHGVDLAAHRAALEAGGATIMVMAEGIEHFRVKKEIADVLEKGKYLVVSQFPPRLPWIARNAMKRNSTIIGLSDGMILVESGNEGGTFAAGDETINRRHPLFVVDFESPGPSAEANPHFIERGGIPIRSRALDRKPNLDRVLEAAHRPRWRVATSGAALFR
jgi:DNA protecting protein DprA